MYALWLQFSSAGCYGKAARHPRKFVAPPVGEDNSDVEFDDSDLDSSDLDDNDLDDSDLDPDYIEEEDLTPTVSGKNKIGHPYTNSVNPRNLDILVV